MKTTQLNHVALHVTDVARSCQFYTNVLRLEPLARPDFDFPGAWFRIGVDQELHLIGGRQQDVISASRGNHWAVMVDDIGAWEAHLRELGVETKPLRHRPDGAMQLFLPDPDGHMIELCTEP
jgi:lactoylglutathione lyase